MDLSSTSGGLSSTSGRLRSLIKILTKKRTSKALFLSRQALETESLAEVQFVTDSCRLVSQSNYWNDIHTRKVIGLF